MKACCVSLSVSLVIAWMLLLMCPSSFAAQPIEVQRINFAAGASSAIVKGSIKGYRIVDYRLSASAGQTMSVKLKTSNLSNYFNVLPPGESEVALFIGSTSGNEWTGTLATDGDYTVRVYLMRSAARRNESAKYALTVGVTNGPGGAAPSGDAKVVGTPYHAAGKVPCSIGPDPKGSAQCTFGVIRSKPGNAEVHVTSPGGTRRVLNFTGDTVTIADPSVHLKASKQVDEWSIAINDYEYYVIPEAVITGG